jgi:hypothetical protein
MDGSMKAAVFPEPVCEETIRSRPSRAAGMACAWDRSWFGVARIGERFQHGRVKANLFKSHQFLSSKWSRVSCREGKSRTQ